MHTAFPFPQWRSIFLATAIISLGFAGLLPAATSLAPDKIKTVYLLHFSHTDFGFTDHPAVCREYYPRYLDIAIDAALATAKAPPERRFYWTAESTTPVSDWWAAASPARRKDFIKALRSGQLEISALPFNNTPFLNREQWQVMIHWLPEEVWKLARPTVAMQNDVNGFPRAGAQLLLDRGVKYLFTGINSDSGGPPFPQPSAFWWKMPDGRRLFVWLNTGYGSGFDLFEPREWRRGPVPLAADTRYRPPRAGDILRTDEASMRAAHQRCVNHLRALEKSGYDADVLTISITSQWRFDNDPPFPPIAEFVAAWNRLGFQPRLQMATVSTAMQHLEKSWGNRAPEYTGEWTDWWANGTASAPREVSASRYAKRYLAEAQSLLWGPVDTRTRATATELYKDLCLFDEHTWGSSLSVALPYSLDSQGQFNEKARLAWRPMAQAQWLLSQRARTRLIGEAEGLWLANASGGPFSGWIKLIKTCLRDNYQSLEDPATGRRLQIFSEPGVQPWGRARRPEDFSRENVSHTFPDRAPDKVASFWVDNLPAQSLRHLRLSTEPAQETASANRAAIQTDAQGWPTNATWPGMSRPLFEAGLGDFVAVQLNAFAPRSVAADIWRQNDAQREKSRAEKLVQTVAEPESKAEMAETPHTFVYTQPLKHPRLQWATRRLEIWKSEPRARLTLRINRLSSFDPEILYAVFPLPCHETLPRLSSGGGVFTPFTDQIPNTCRDYFAVDGWAHYPTAAGHWLWATRDVPLICFGAPQALAKTQSPPKNPGRLLAMLFNNFWYTNFQGDSPGVMDLQFDLAWRPDLATPQAATIAEGFLTEPVVLINPGLKEEPLVIRHLYRP